MYIGFEKITDGSNETTLLLFKEYDDNGNAVSLLSVRWGWERNASNIELEIYKQDGLGGGECSKHSYYITKPMIKEIERNDFQLTYENGQIVGWHQLTIE